MTDKTALRQLIEAVEAGTQSPFITLSDAEVLAFNQEQINLIQKANAGSLDAAKALHEALLPHYGWKVEGDNTAWVWWSLSNEWSGKSTTAARAWLIAILKAYEAQQ